MGELLSTINGLDVLWWVCAFFAGRGYQKLVERSKRENYQRMTRDNLGRRRE